MKPVLLALVLFSLISVSFGLKCNECYAESCESQSTIMECTKEWPAVACGTYKLNNLVRKSCILENWCNATVAPLPGSTDFECCNTDMCNYSVSFRGNINVAFVFCAVTLNYFF